MFNQPVSSVHSDPGESGGQEDAARRAIWDNALHSQANEGEFKTATHSHKTWL